MDNTFIQDSTLLNNVINQFVDLGGVSPNGGTSTEYYDRMFLDGLIHKVVTTLPLDATKLEPKFLVNGSEDKSINKALNNTKVISRSLDDIAWLDAIYQAVIFGRLYGDGFLIVGYSDTADLSKPLSNRGNLKIKWLTVRSRREVSIDTVKRCYQLLVSDYDNNGSELIGKVPSTSLMNIHPSRVIRFKGLEIYEQALAQNSYYNRSILDLVYPYFCKYKSTIESLDKMVGSHSAFSYGINDLSVMVKQGKSDLIKNRFELILKSIARIGGVAYDKNNEEVSYIQRNYGGLNDLVEQIKGSLLAISGLPAYKLWGTSNSGAMSTSATQEAVDYAQIVSTYQQAELDNPLVRLIKPTLAPDTDLTVEFRNLYQTSESSNSENNLDKLGV